MALKRFRGGGSGRWSRLLVVVASTAALTTVLSGTADAAAAACAKAAGQGDGAPDSAARFASAIGDLAQWGTKAPYAGAFASIKVDEKAQRVTVFAKDVDRARTVVAAARGRVDSRVRKQVKVEVHQSKYSRAELETARERFFKSVPQLKQAGTEVYGVSIKPDGLAVDVPDPAKATSLMQTRAFTGAAPGVDVSFRRGERSKDAPVAKETVGVLSRADDYPPFASGTYMGHPLLGNCSTAYSIAQSNVTYLMTAGHCFNPGTQISTAGGSPVGRVVSHDTLTDAASIATNTWSGVFYFGENWTHFRDSLWSYDNERVCHSGYISDQICLTVVDEEYWWIGDNGYQRMGVRALADPGCGPGSYEGDSGGPVWSWRGDWGLHSRGLVSSGGFASNYINFTETNRLLERWPGTRLLTR
ncbi:hypothetical protein ACGFNU_14475 [Spirillospora sp. NPDC048911]|uniref:hypothetical protein n=1 Tax=Spirillospora sp. NPDC048911 TaxID=3364527 RepID=UPI0037136189